MPDFVGDTISENVEFRQSLPGLVDLVTQAKKKDEPVRLMAPGATDVVAYMNRKKEQFNHIENLYWSIAVQIMRCYDRTSGLWIRNATTGVSL